MEVHAEVKRHRDTDLWMVIAPDLPGFVVHAHSEDELRKKIGPAFESFMRASGRPIRNLTVVTRSKEARNKMTPTKKLRDALLRIATDCEELASCDDVPANDRRCYRSIERIARSALTPPMTRGAK